MKLREYITESFKKEYAYRLKFAADITAEDVTQIEKCLAKYNVVSVSPVKRTPIEENPQEFVRAKGVSLTSEVCSTDIVLKYPVNERILEVWLAVNVGLPHERVLCYGVKEPRRLEADIQAQRLEQDVDRHVSEEDAQLANEEQAHYEEQNADLDFEVAYFGEEYNQKFLQELQRIKAEKGADYFRNYPSKDELMGDNLRPMFDTLTGTPNMGRGAESSKHVDVIQQSGRRN